jgi:hypothetical protein
VPIFAPLMKVFDANPEIRDTVEKDPKIEKEFMRFFSNIVSSFSSEQIEELEKSFKTSGETG